MVEQGIQQGGEQQQGQHVPHLTHQGSPALQPGGVSQGADQRNPQTHWVHEKHGESQNQDEKEEPNDGMKRRKSVPLHTDSLLAAALVFSLPIFTCSRIISRRNFVDKMGEENGQGSIVILHATKPPGSDFVDFPEGIAYTRAI